MAAEPTPSSPYDPSPYLDPTRCAVVVFECMEMLLGEDVPYPGLRNAVRASGMLDTLSGLLDAARETGATVFYCTVGPGPAGLGGSKTPMTEISRRAAAAASTPAAPVDRSVVAELAPVEGDVVVDRSHGMSGFHGTELDSFLRDLNIETIIPTGVSANVGVIGTAIEAVNHGYRLVVAPDCIASDPPEYGEAMMRYSYRNIAYMSSASAIAQEWRRRAAAG